MKTSGSSAPHSYLELKISRPDREGPMVLAVEGTNDLAKIVSTTLGVDILADLIPHTLKDGRSGWRLVVPTQYWNYWLRLLVEANLLTETIFYLSLDLLYSPRSTEAST